LVWGKVISAQKGEFFRGLTAKPPKRASARGSLREQA